MPQVIITEYYVVDENGTSGKGNLQMIKKTPHFLLNFLQISTIFASFSVGVMTCPKPLVRAGLQPRKKLCRGHGLRAKIKSSNFWVSALHQGREISR
jgi:hypothetical protein